MRLACGLWITCIALGECAERNAGPPSEAVFQGHVLSPAGGGARILYAPSESDDPTYRARIAEHIGGVCDYFDARFDTPDSLLLSSYDCVHTWSNYPFSDPALFGDRLADYVDHGGKVLLGAYATSQHGNSLAGRLVDPAFAYLPVASLGAHNGMSAWDGTCHEDCVYQDVPGVYASHRQTVTLIDPAHGVVCGRYVDGEIFVAYTANRRVYYLNGAGGYPVFDDDYMAAVVGNACRCSTVPTAIESSTWGVVKHIFR